MEISSAKEIINRYFKDAYNIYEINRGVMNFKFHFSSNCRDYILRCYPKGREVNINVHRERGEDVELIYLKGYKSSCC